MSEVAYRGYRVDLERGHIYGPRGGPLGSLNGSGYLQFDGRRCGIGRPSVARFVWEAAHGPIPDGYEINHRNGVKTDNRITNLELVTHQENIRHAYATGLKTNAGEKHPSARLTESTVREIRAAYRRYSRDGNARVLANRFGVTRKCIADVVARKTWTHIESEAACQS